MKFLLPKLQKLKRVDDTDAYLYGDIDINIHASRYINIAELLGMMNGYIRVPMRMSFPDKLEHGLPYNTFSHCLSVSGVPITKKDLQQWDEVKQNRIAISNWFTLCFSEELQERASFWNAFTNGVNGVFLETRLVDFISAIDTTDFNLYIGKIKYSNSISTHDFVDFAFTKESPYRDEKEIRIYLLPKKGELDWPYEDGKSRLEMKFNFSPQIFSKITLSPYIPSEVRKIFLKELFEQSKFNISQFNTSTIH